MINLSACFLSACFKIFKNLILFKSILILFIFIICKPVTVFADLVSNSKNNNPVNLTIYSDNTTGLGPEFYRPTANLSNAMTQIPGFAVVRIQKPFEFTMGPNTIIFTEVATQIDPATVMVKSLTDPLGTKVIEQNYRFDITSIESLLERYLWKEITVEQVKGDKIESYTGLLLSSNIHSGMNTGINSNVHSAQGLILQNKENKIININHYSNILFPELPEELMTKPSLIWNITADKKGPQTLEISYQTSGMTWWTNYNAILEENNKGKSNQSSFLHLNTWVSIINKSGTSFENASIKLIAGEVNRVQSSANMMPMATSMSKVGVGAEGVGGFSEKPFYEYHLYTLDRQINLTANSTLQLELFPKVSKIPVELQYEYLVTQQKFYGQPILNKESSEFESTKVETYLKFKNNSSIGLGIPLPAGKIRMSKINSEDGTMEFIGEDAMKPTAKNEEVRLKLGTAFDVVGKRTQTHFVLDEKRHILEETIEIEIKNHKPNDIKVLIKENMYRTLDWKIEESSTSYEKLDSQTIQIPLQVKSESESKIKYTVQYSW